MADSNHSTTQIQTCLDRLRAGEESARDELFNITYGRIQRLAHKMLGRYRGVSRWVQTDDVRQDAAVRLLRALKNDVKPESVRSFVNLAAVQIRHALVDLARHYYGPEGLGRHHASGAESDRSEGQPGPLDVTDETNDPGRLAVWTEFHEKVGALPEELKEVVNLRFYLGLTHAEAALLLDVSERVVKYRWHLAQLELHEMLGGHLPD